MLFFICIWPRRSWACLGGQAAGGDPLLPNISGNPHGALPGSSSWKPRSEHRQEEGSGQGQHAGHHEHQPEEHRGQVLGHEHGGWPCLERNFGLQMGAGWGQLTVRDQRPGSSPQKRRLFKQPSAQTGRRQCTGSEERGQEDDAWWLRLQRNAIPAGPGGALSWALSYRPAGTGS